MGKAVCFSGKATRLVPKAIRLAVKATLLPRISLRVPSAPLTLTKRAAMPLWELPRAAPSNRFRSARAIRLRGSDAQDSKPL